MSEDDSIVQKLRELLRLIAVILVIYYIYKWYKDGLGKYCWKLIFPLYLLAVPIIKIMTVCEYDKSFAYTQLRNTIIVVGSFTIIVLIGRFFDARARTREETGNCK